MESQPLDDGLVTNEKHISLSEERLNVEISRKKIGEVVVRKEIETRIVEIPIRQEKLIVEQISPETKRLAEINLGESKVIETSNHQEIKPSFEANFSSLQEAITTLSALYHQYPQANLKVRVQVVDEDGKNQPIFLESLEHHLK
ncbi:MAG: DUF2382 domain-containing protein [Cyanobacteria bacterium P01_G01_bin.49]